MIFTVAGICLLWLVCGSSGQSPPQSPCPDVFSYQHDNSRGWYGIVTILPPATFSRVLLIFKMTVADYNLEGGYGRIEMLGGNAEVQEISKRAFQGVRQRIHFLINFPPSRNIPRVKEIVINNTTFCADYRDYGHGANIALDYVVQTGLDIGEVSGNAFSVLPARLHQIPNLGTNANFLPQDKAHPTTPPNKVAGHWYEYNSRVVLPAKIPSSEYRPSNPAPGLTNTHGHNKPGSGVKDTEVEAEQDNSKKQVVLRVEAGNTANIHQIIVQFKKDDVTKNVTANFSN